MAEQLQLIETKPDGRNTTPIPLTQFPITIGRGHANYRVAVGASWPADYRNSLSRVQATLMKRRDQVWLKDGGHQPSANGIYVGGRRITRPIRLLPGADIELALTIQGCGLRLIWPVENLSETCLQEPPTLQFERKTVGAELDWSQRRVLALEQLVETQEARLKELTDQSKRVATLIETLRTELLKQKRKNSQQDARILKARQTLRIVCGVVAVGAVVVLGWDVQQLDKVVGGVLAITSALAAATSADSQE